MNIPTFILEIIFSNIHFNFRPLSILRDYIKEYIFFIDRFDILFEVLLNRHIIDVLLSSLK